MSVLDDFGLEGVALQDQSAGSFPAMVPGRVAHIDADFTAYMIGCDTVAELAGDKPMRSVEKKCTQLENWVHWLTAMAGAEKYVLHITPPGSNKGHRADQVVQAEYQATRKDREPPADLNAMRQFMYERLGAIAHLDQEADDGMSRAAWADPLNVIICSKDKDLRMCPGWHLDMDDFKPWYLPKGDFGKLWVVRDAEDKPKGIKGIGPKWFFAQCLMGDTADNVKGLPKVTPKFWMPVMPTNAWIAALESENEEKQAKVLANSKPKPCGEMTTYKLLEDVHDVASAFKRIKAMFQDIGETQEFLHWKTGVAVTPTAALLGDMLALWMRRNDNPYDVVDWLKENLE